VPKKNRAEKIGAKFAEKKREHIRACMGLLPRTLSPLISPLINLSTPRGAKVAGIYRPHFLLRANGRDAEADRVSAMSYRRPFRGEQENTRHDSPRVAVAWGSLSSTPRKRAADAHVRRDARSAIAERLRPSLVIEPVESRTPFPSYREPPRRPEPPRNSSASAPIIADLIDGISAQERGGARPPPPDNSAQRRKRV